MAPQAHIQREGPLVEVRNLHVGITGERVIPVLDGVSFDIMPGEILGVVGESGAGKSITGTALTGLIERPLAIRSGEIFYDGRRIDNLPPDALRQVRGKQIATIFQDPLTALNPVFSIGRQIVETVEEHTGLSGSEARRESIALLAQVGIPAPETRLESYPHEFSGGMRQRVVIALALAGRPRLIVADEPTTALDVSIQGQIIAVLRGLCEQRGTAVMLITHDMGVIAEAANRVAVMYAGRIVEIGPVADVVRRPRHPYTRGLMDSIPTIGRRLRRLSQIDGAMPRPGSVPAGCAFAARCARADDLCRSQRPDLAAGTSWRVACWHADESTAS